MHDGDRAVTGASPDEDGSAPAPESAAAGTASPPAGGRLLSGIALLLAGAIIVLGLLAALAHRRTKQGSVDATARVAAGVAAIHTFTDLTSLDYSAPADYVRRVGADTTGELHDEVAQQTAAGFQGDVAQQQQVLEGSATTIAIGFPHDGQVDALVLGTVTTTAHGQTTGTTAPVAYRLTLRLVHGQWLADSAASIATTPSSTAPSETPGGAAPSTGAP